MSKLLSTLFLTLGVVYAMPATADFVPSGGGQLYIQDASKEIVFTYGGFDGKHQSYATHTVSVFVTTLDADGNFLDDWLHLFDSQGSPFDTATLVSGSSALPNVPGDPYSFVFNPNANAVELVFLWFDSDTIKLQVSDVLVKESSNILYNQVVTYGSNNWAQVGLEDFGGGLDWNDVLFQVSNVGSAMPMPAIPEPETYAMMLAGLGMVGAMVRRRKSQ